MSESLHKIALDDAETLFRGRMGLIYGPGITGDTNFFDTLANNIAQGWNLPPAGDYLGLAQQVLNQGIDVSSIREIVRQTLVSRRGAGYLKRIANLKWSAALSLALDSAFERDLRKACQRRASSYTATQVVEFGQVLPFKTIPVFKLLGDAEANNVILSELEYVTRRPRWRDAVQEFADKVRDHPVVCLGLAGCQRFFLDLLAQLVSEPKTRLSPMLLLESEFDANARKAIVAVTQDRVQIGFIDVPLHHLVSRIQDVVDAGETLPLVFNKPGSEFDRLAPFQDIVTVVNTHLVPQVGREESARLLDLLFSPTLPRWDPFHYNLDFRRSLGKKILDTLVKPVRAERSLPTFALVGSAASGKTTMAKRLAYDLATKGYLVCWFRRAFYPNVQGLLSDFFRELTIIAGKAKRIFFFVDDPLGLGSISMQAIAANAQSQGIKCTFILVARTSDQKTHEPHEISGSLDLVQDFQLEDQFDHQEMEALPNYLVSLGIFADSETARREIANAPSRSTSDTLGLLYWLLPRTRQSIEASIREEYLRLGERAGLSRIIIGAYNKTTAFLRQAYAMVAVSDHYRTPVPIEVLVSALHIPYSDWMEAVGTDGPAWGLLYVEPSFDGETVAYRPRNSVVTSILVETINGGNLAHSGEVEQLSMLLSACSGTSPVYREFCANILAPRSKLSDLDYADGLQLYDAAISALPLQDRTLQHQKGLWIKEKGDDSLLALEVLDAALKTDAYPYTSRGEADEHIHTSMAATILDASDRGQIGLQEAIPGILQHLDRARSESFFNPRAVHVQANLMLRLVTKLEDRQSADTYHLLNQALIAVDSALLVLKNPLRDKRDRPNKDIEFLEGISGKLYEKILPLDELKESAVDLWHRFKRQEGFVIAARKLFHMAREKNSGTAFNEAFAYCRQAFETVQAESHKPSPDLCAIAVSIYYEWNINRYDQKAGVRQIDWAMLDELSRAVLQSNKYAGDLFYKFVCAVALAQQGKWADANLLFAQIRQAGLPSNQLYDIRAVLLDDEGMRIHVQGTITGDNERKYLKVDQLHSDFYLERSERWANPGEIQHAYIGFRFAGPVAVQSL